MDPGPSVRNGKKKEDGIRVCIESLVSLLPVIFPSSSSSFHIPGHRVASIHPLSSTSSARFLAVLPLWLVYVSGLYLLTWALVFVRGDASKELKDLEKGSPNCNLSFLRHQPNPPSSPRSAGSYCTALPSTACSTKYSPYPPLFTRPTSLLLLLQVSSIHLNDMTRDQPTRMSKPHGPPFPSSFSPS